MDGILDIAGERINYEFVRNSNIRNVYMKFDGDKLVVRSPSYTYMNKILDKHKTWIVKHYRQIKQSVRIFEKNYVVLSGKKYLALFKHVYNGFGVEITNDCVIVSAKEKEHANLVIERWMRRRSLETAKEKTLEKASLIGVNVNKIGIRRSKRWGTCTSKGIITYNPCLAALPNEMIDYVVSHEVAHLKEMNHSRRFWSVVETMYPAYSAARKQLHCYDSKYREVFAD